MLIESAIKNKTSFRCVLTGGTLWLMILSPIIMASMGCTKMKQDKEILEYENVAQYSLGMDPKTKVPNNVSGLCFKSSSCVSGFTVSREGASLLVLVEIGPCEQGQSGRFSIPLDVSNDVNDVKFGNEKRLLWSRSSGTNGL